MSKDYYKILGVDKNASKDEIKQAFRKLAQQHHPDKKGGDEKKFKEINEAYQILSDDNKRQQYDQFGTAFEQGGFSDFYSSFSQGFGGQRGFSGQAIDLEDLLSNIFGDFFGGSFYRRKSRGQNFIADIEIDLKDGMKGIEREIQIGDHHIKLRIKIKPPKN